MTPKRLVLTLLFFAVTVLIVLPADVRGQQNNLSNAATLTVNTTASSVDLYQFAYVLDNALAYVGPGNVQVVNLDSEQHVATIPFNESDYYAGVAIAAGGSKAYIVGKTAAELIVVDTATRIPVKRIPVSESPDTLIASPDGSRLYLTHDLEYQDTGLVSVIDTISDAVIAIVPNLVIPHLAALPADGQTLYVGSFGHPPAILAIDTETYAVAPPIELDVGPVGLAVHPDGSEAYVPICDVLSGSRSIAILDLVAQAVDEVIALPDPAGSECDLRRIVLSLDSASAFMIDNDRHEVIVFSTVARSVVTTIPLPTPTNSYWFTLSTDGTLLYVVLLPTGEIVAIDTATLSVKDTIPVPGRPSAIAIVAPRQPFELTVNSTADPGDGSCDWQECTLREAIEAANANPGRDLISFNIPGDGPHTIAPITPLPFVTDPVTIDGYTQPGAFPNTNGVDDALNGVIQIALDGSNLPEEASLLVLRTWDSTVTGLSLQNCPGSNAGTADAFVSGSGLLLQGGGRHTVGGNYVGVAPDGIQPAGNRIGIMLDGSHDNQIGGQLPHERNLVSSNKDSIQINWGTVEFGPSNRNVVQGNLIGTDYTGQMLLPPIGEYGSGILIGHGSGLNVIGGLDAAARNVIAGYHYGVFLVDCDTEPNYILGNHIGTDITGMISLGNRTGVWVGCSAESIIGSADGGGNVISGNEIGVETNHCSGDRTQIIGNLIGVAADSVTPLGNTVRGVSTWSGDGQTVVGDGHQGSNQIAYNGGEGIWIYGWGFGDARVAVSANLVFANGGLGIDRVPEGVSAENAPVLTAAASTDSGINLRGSLPAAEPDATYRLEFFANRACDPSGYGEGEQYLGFADVTTDSTGSAAFDVTVASGAAIGRYITATATNANGSTSEFSACFFGAGVTAIELVSFDASADASGLVTLQWETAAEVDNAGFNLYRRATGSDADANMLIMPELIGSQSSAGSGAAYAFTDSPGYGGWTYTLASVTTDGVELVEDSVDVMVEGPTSAELAQIEGEGASTLVAVAALLAVALALVVGVTAYVRSTSRR